MSQTWALVTQSNETVLVSGDARLLKFVQLILAKTFILHMISRNDGVFPTPVGSSDLPAKAEYILTVLSVEEDGIKQAIIDRENNNIKRDMLFAKEFYDLVFPNDPIIGKTIDLEVQEISNYRDAFAGHKGFIYRILYGIDYTLSLEKIRKEFREGFRYPPSDHYYVYESLQEHMENKLRDHGLF